MLTKTIPTVPILEFLARLERKEIAHSYEGFTGEITDELYPDGVPEDFESKPTTITWYPTTGCAWGPDVSYCVVHAMPEGTPRELVLSKMQSLMDQGLVEGCACGCRGDFGLTDRGRELLAANKSACANPNL